MQARATPDGRRFLFGEALNLLLMRGEPALRCYGLWTCLTGAALNTGGKSSDFPDLGRQFGIVSQRLGTEEEGFPDVDPAHRPALATGSLVERLWPRARVILTQDFPERPGPLGAVPERFWSSVMDIAANRLFSDALAAIDARTGMEIVLQSAIYGSKLLPPPAPQNAPDRAR